MNPELEEQQKLVFDLKEKLQSMETEEKDLTEKVRVLETKLVVQDLQGKVKVKSEAIDQLRSKVEELEEKLKSNKKPETEEALPKDEEMQLVQPQEVAPPQEEEKTRRFF
jgi:hypothetical protein